MSLVQPMYAQVRSPRTLSIVAIGGLSAALVVGLGLTVLQIHAYGMLADASAGVAQTEVAALLLLGGGLIDVVVQLFCGIAFICWLYRVRSNLDALPETFRWSAGWAIGGWFVPIASLFIPLAIVGEVDRASERQAGRPRRAGVFVGWVVSWTAYTVVDNVTAIMFRLRIADRGAQHIVWASIVGVLGAVGAGFAILLVRRITVNQETVIASRPTSPPAFVVGPVS
jgi:hypothetical protein